MHRSKSGPVVAETHRKVRGIPQRSAACNRPEIKKNPTFPEWSFSYRFRTKLDMFGERSVDFRFLLKLKERCILKDFGVKKQKIYTTLST